MRKYIVLHDRYSNEPLIIFTDSITALQVVYDAELSNKDRRVTYCCVYVKNFTFSVTETNADVMRKLKEVDNVTV